MFAQLSKYSPPGFCAWATTLAGALVASLFAYIVYQLFLHPLSKYPGPFLAKISHFPRLYQTLKGTRHENLLELHRKYGAYVRYGPDHVSINSVSALEQIYGHRANVQKSSWYDVYYSISIFNAIDKSVHARKKRVMSQAFSDKAVRGMEPHVVSAIDTWCSGLVDGDEKSEKQPVQQTGGGSSAAGKWSSPRNMVDWAGYMIFDVLGEICFGDTFGTSVKSDNRFFLNLMENQIRLLNFTGQMRIFKRFDLGKFFMPNSKGLRQKQVAFSRQQLGKRLSYGPDGNGRRDIIYYLQQARDPETGQGYSEAELVSECVLLLGAGSDTANGAFTSIFYFLLHNPDVYNRLTAEIRTTFSAVDEIVSGPALSSMTYMRACLDESLRLCPPVPMLLPREVLPGGLLVDGNHFPAGCIVGVPTYALHHSEEHFPQPYRYDPGRWLIKGTNGVKEGEGHTLEEVQHAREAFAPFSMGPRACIGRGVAMLELQVGLARALWLYDMRLAPGTESLGVGRGGEYKMKDFFVVGKEGPVVQFRKRARSD